MKNILPAEVFQNIQDRFKAGISDAEEWFDNSEQDEDSLTGALGQSISSKNNNFHYENNEKKYEWKTYYKKIRGRGKNAPEKKLGADGIFQIEIKENNKVIFTKGLPFQSKKNWNFKDKKLVEQLENVLEHTETGIVVDYQKSGYTACDAKYAVKYEGRKKELINRNHIYSLAHVIGSLFLTCKIGKKGLFYNDNEEFITDSHLIGVDINIRSKKIKAFDTKKEEVTPVRSRRRRRINL